MSALGPDSEVVSRSQQVRCTPHNGYHTAHRPLCTDRHKIKPEMRDCKYPQRPPSRGPPRGARSLMVLYNLPLEKIAKVPKPTNKANQIGNRSACISICLQFPLVGSFTGNVGGHRLLKANIFITLFQSSAIGQRARAGSERRGFRQGPPLAGAQGATVSPRRAVFHFWKLEPLA